MGDTDWLDSEQVKAWLDERRPENMRYPRGKEFIADIQDVKEMVWIECGMEQFVQAEVARIIVEATMSDAERWVDEKWGPRNIKGPRKQMPAGVNDYYREALIEAVKIIQRANAAYFSEPDRAIAAIKMYDELSSFLLEGLDERT